MIGIIGALTEEVKLLVEQTQVAETVSLCGLTFYAGTLEGQNVVIVKCGVGKVHAAMAATTLAVRFSCDTIVNTGVAGGTVGRGETVVSERLVQHDVHCDADGLPQGQLDGFASPFIAADGETVARLRAAAAESGINVHVGTIVSGDQFICKAADVRQLADGFDAKAIDMESAAIAQVCAIAGIRFCALRTVTDNADESAPSDFYELLHVASVKSSKILLAYLRAL